MDSLSIQSEPLEHEKNVQHEYLQGRALWAAMGGTCLVVFVHFLDGSILGPAIPNITDEFESLHDIGWYGSAYFITNTVFQPIAGKIFTFLPTKWSLIGFILFFEIGSLLCGIASSSAMLILGRAVAGMGGSGLLIGNQTVIAGLAPLEKRPGLTAVVMSLAAPGMLLGPIVGGIITEYSTWRWIFYMNLPIGAVAILLLVFTGIPEQTAKPDWRIVLRGLHHYFDILGCGLCTAATCLLLLVLNIGGDLLPWNSPILIGMFVFSVILFAFFVYWSVHMGHQALMPPSIAKQRVVWSGAATLMFTIGATTVQSYFLPLYFQSVRGESAMTGALYTIPGLPGQILFSLASGFLIGKIGYYLPWAVAGTAVHTVACGLLSRFSTATPTPYWILSQFLAGCGRGMSLQSPSIATQVALPQDQISIASSIVTFGMYLGSALASTAASVTFDNVLQTEVERRISNAAAADMVLTGGATEFRQVLSGDELTSALDAFAGGLRGVFLLATGLSGVSFLFAWGMRSSNAGTQRTEESSVKETKGVIGANAN
ncbi:Putative major facilitator superfamily, MFS transporter superfamily [Colletotrichum destructivum]|uniref:Major facilitator superfamily, MFS transporter superfamily n=1 Tax=Colletotrichum destructivum TaxID=34406 RepID=A0AAX4IY25_9PEZI|nr:Putative major facilitator superfamily, MFS transporter superfamily [Colletotrichum destructivum]